MVCARPASKSKGVVGSERLGMVERSPEMKI